MTINKKYFPGPITIGMLVLAIGTIISTYGEKTTPFFETYLGWTGPFQMGLTCLIIGFGAIAVSLGLISVLYHYDEWRKK